MKCEFCSTEIAETITDCPKCNAKVQITCDSCKSLTSVFEIKCKQCGTARPTELIPDVKQEGEPVSRPPWLASLLRLFGLLLLMLLVALMVFSEKYTENIVLRIVSWIFIVALILLCFGLAQIIDAMHKTTSRIDELYKKFGQK